jgi:hypothetical protein
MAEETEMSIENVLEQEAIADSLLDDSNIIGRWPSNEGIGGNDGALADLGEEVQDGQDLEGQYDSADEILGELAEQIPSEQQFESVAQTAPELTPSQVEEGIAQLSQTVEQLGLNDQAAALQLATDLTAPFGADPRSIDSQALGKTMAAAVVSGLQIAETANAQNMGPIPLLAAQAFTGDFLRAFGADPRMTSVDSQAFATAILNGTLSFIEAVKNHGLNASLDRLNSPEGAERFANGLLKAFGVKEPVTRPHALHLADAGGKYILSILRRLEQTESQASPRRSRNTTARQSTQRRGRGSSHFQTNTDIFDSEALEFYQRNHRRL